jgi:hypothetical protein
MTVGETEFDVHEMYWEVLNLPRILVHSSDGILFVEHHKQVFKAFAVCLVHVTDPA